MFINQVRVLLRTLHLEDLQLLTSIHVLQMRIDGDNEQLASELMLATRQRSQVEISAAWNEQPRVQSRDSRNDLTLSNAPLELTMSLQPPQPHPDPYVRSEILTLDLTQQLNRPRLEPPR